MKTLKFTITITATLFMLFLFTSSVFAQLEFVGNYADGMGGAGWNADGSGPEPYGNGHGDIFYYIASRDYLGGECGAEMTDILGDFPLFEQSLVDNGFTTDQVTLKFALANLGDDIEGVDYFSVAGTHYCNFYPVVLTFELNGEEMVECVGNYTIFISGTNVREFESGFLKINNISGSSSPLVQNVSAAFIDDMDGEELQLVMQLSENLATLSGYGRSGAYGNVSCILDKGLPEIPFKGLNTDHEGFAGWDADGTGLEPFGNGPNTQLYYGASLDYDAIDPDPDACLGHFLDGQKGFLNTILQLQYRGYEIGDLKCKLGLNSLGPMVEGEDWSDDVFNYYYNLITFELENEPILTLLCDTNVLVYNNVWSNITSVGMVYNISENATQEAQYVAQSFMKDLGTHYLRHMSSNIVYGSSFEANGRNGALYQILSGKIQAVHDKASFIPEGAVSGTWTAENSPYYIEGPITIENNQTLNIEPGVCVATRGAFPITVKGCVIAEGTASNMIMFTASNPNITWDGLDYEGNSIISTNPSKFDHCIFQYGQAMGGGEYNSGGAFAVRDYNELEIYNSVFRHNIADLEDATYVTCGGAIALWNASPLVQSCVFYDNYALDYAGAILVYMGSEPVISNCLFYYNKSARGGAIAFYEYSNGILINSTITNNLATEYGGALYFYKESNPEIINNILWDNEASNQGNEVYFSVWASQPGFYYNDIEGGEEGFGGLNFNGEYLYNIDDDPLFELNEEFPYKISDESPCINIGVPSSSSFYYEEYQPEYCLCGFIRDYGSCIDMGAYETDVISTFVNSIDEIDKLDLYPNPTNSVIFIRGAFDDGPGVSIEIFNFLGQKVDAYKELPHIGKEIELDVRNLQTGTYFCKLTNRSKVYTSKFIKK